MSDETAILENYRAQLSAMTESRTDLLDPLLDDDFTLTHISGYIQPKSEWLDQMDDGQFVYHNVREIDSDVQLSGDTARLTTRIITDATVYGTRNDWRLRFTMDFGQQDGQWVALRTVATTW